MNRAVLLSLFPLCLLGACERAPDAASDAPQATDASAPSYLFVQNADGVEVGEGTLTLKDVSPTTVYFTDRPDRIAGHGPTTDFIKLWGQGEDSFRADPPNATLSILEGDHEAGDVVVTLTNPRLDGQDLTYDIEIIEGKLPKTGGAAALFVDVLVVRRPAYRARAVVR